MKRQEPIPIKQKKCAFWWGGEHRKTLFDQTQRLTPLESSFQEKRLFCDCWKTLCQTIDYFLNQKSLSWIVGSHRCRIYYQVTTFSLEGFSDLKLCSYFFDCIHHFLIYLLHYHLTEWYCTLVVDFEEVLIVCNWNLEFWRIWFMTVN